MENSRGTMIITINRTEEGISISKVFNKVAPHEVVAIGEILKTEALELIKTQTISSKELTEDKEMD
jgi:hypothetical protein